MNSVQVECTTNWCLLVIAFYESSMAEGFNVEGVKLDSDFEVIGTFRMNLFKAFDPAYMAYLFDWDKPDEW